MIMIITNTPRPSITCTIHACHILHIIYLLFFLKGGGPTKKSKIDNGEKEGEEDDKEIGEADKEKAGEKEEEEKEEETKMETEEQQPPPPAAAAADKEEETDEKKKTSEKEELKQDAQPMDAQQEVKQVSIHHTHFAFCVSRNVVCCCNVGVACYKVGRLVLCGKYFTSSTVLVHMRPLYSICTSILPTFCLLSTGSRHMCPWYLHIVLCPLYQCVHCSCIASIVLFL